MENNGFIVLNRKILDWQWADDPLTGWLWVHLLLRANVKDKKWHNIVVKRGQLVTSTELLSLWTGLTKKQVRIRLERLIEDGCVGKQTTNKYTLITICKYDVYQNIPNRNDMQKIKEGQTKGKQRANKGQQLNNETNILLSTTTRAREEDVLIESRLNEWQRSDIVTKGSIPELTESWIEEVKLLIRRFTQQELTTEDVCRQYEDFQAQEATETLQDNYDNWRKHFGNFVRKRIMEEKKNGTTGTSATDYNSPEARAKRQEGYARVMQELLDEGKQPKKDVPRLF